MGDRDSVGPDRELDDRAVGLARQLDVEVDVLCHVGCPDVVDRRERVVGAHHVPRYNVYLAQPRASQHVGACCNL